MAVLSLPLTFTNSFWSQDYRRGLHVLYDKLEQGVAENEEIVSFIRARAIAETFLAQSLTTHATGKSGSGFDADDGASLFMAFRGLQRESAAQGKAHHNVAKELTTLVADPFEDWALRYKDRLKQSRVNTLDNWLRSYEQAHADVSRLKQQYLAKVRKADEADDDAKFAPTSNGPMSDKYTNSPRLRPADRTPPQRSASVSDRIAQRLREIQKKSVEVIAHATSTEDPSPAPPSEAEGEGHESENPLPKVDKGKGKEINEKDAVPKQMDSPPPMSPIPPPKDLAPQSQIAFLSGLSFTPAALSELLTKASTELPLRPVRFPLLGEYQDAFTGDEIVAWLKDNVVGLDGNLDRAEEMARELTEREGLLRRLGELGNEFEDSENAFYQFRPKAFDLDQLDPSKAQPDTILKKTGTLYSLVSKALNNTTSSTSEPAHIRARYEAEEADKAYRIGVRQLDRQRLALEELIEDTLKVLQRWESERLRAVKTVLLQYQGTLSNLPKSLEPSMERSGTILAAFQPEQDLVALIERYRTGPFRPDPQVYESVAHEESDVVFGIDLRRWSEGGWYAAFTTQSDDEDEKNKVKMLVPPVLTAMLSSLETAYAKCPTEAEKRKAWIYEVPLPAVHYLRESLNAIPPGQPFPPELFAKFDAPVIAACVKLWALELNPPLATYEGWDEFRKLYQARKSDSDSTNGEEGEKDHLEKVASALQRLPKVHLYVLDAIVRHLKNLVATTKVEESDEVYFTKLALSMGRTILRPKVETELSVQDRHPTSLIIDLLKHYDTLIPPTIERKKRESERRLLIRKRTAPTDMRLSRSKITLGADAAQLLAAQQIAQNPSLANKAVKSSKLPSPPPVGGVASRQQKILASPPAAGGFPVPPPPPPVVSNRMKTSPPPPPPPVAQAIPPPPPLPTSISPAPPPPPLLKDNGPSIRPNFKDPLPELDLPPMPTFKEPPPEVDDFPPRPVFTDPPREDDTMSTTSPQIPSPPLTNVIPPTPQKQTGRMGKESPRKIASRSPSPPTSAGAEDIVLGTGRSNISRVGSAQSSTTAMRGPRLARAPGRPLSGNVQSLVQNLNRHNGPVPSVSPKPNRFSGSGSGASSPVRRPSSIVGRNATAFSRRTMASDAEDDLVDRK